MKVPIFPDFVDNLPDFLIVFTDFAYKLDNLTLTLTTTFTFHMVLIHP